MLSSIKERSAARRKNITIKKMDLHSTKHHSFHTHFDTKSSWELLAKLSKEAWIEKTGKTPPKNVDKSVYRFISLSEKV